MTSQNVEIVTSLYEAFTRRDITTVMRLVDPEIVVSQTELLPWGGTYHGQEGLKQFFGNLLEHLDSQIEIQEVVDGGERICVIGRTRGLIKSNQAPFDIRLVHVWTMKDGKGLRFEPNIETPEMLRLLPEN